MLKGLFSLCLMLAVLPLVQQLHAQGLALNYLTATPDGSDMIIRWEVPDESGITDFKVFRKMGDESDFQQLTTMAPTGSRSYEYVDYTLFRGEPRTINYRLQVHKNGMVYSYYVSVMHNPTSVQRTWGSIKAMFR